MNGRGAEKGYVPTLWQVIKGSVLGLWITFIHLFRRPITESYPEYKRPLSDRARGRIILTRDPSGEERCVACFLCSAVCPVNCISMEAEERNNRRMARWFRINFARCIFCGFCEEACPTLAIQLTPDYEMCRYDLLSLVAEKEDLLVKHGGKNKEYNYYRHAGVTTLGGKGSHVKEESPVNVRSNMP